MEGKGIREFESRPGGQWDNDGRWFPDKSERCPCCNKIRNPSMNWPYSLWVHCKSKKHYKELMKKYGIEDKTFEKASARPIEHKNGFKAVLCENGKLISLWAHYRREQAFEYVPGKWKKEKVVKDIGNDIDPYKGGLYLFSNLDDTEDFVNDFFYNTARKILPSVKIYSCTARYFEKIPEKGKYICSMLRLDEFVKDVDFLT